MLVLTRRVGETLSIGDLVKIKIVRVKGNQISIGVEAPREVSVTRTELIKEAERIGKQSLSY